MKIPGTIDEIDNAWLRGVLGEGVSLTGVSSLTTGTAYSTTMHRLHLDGGPTGTPPSVIVKLPVGGEVRQLLDGIGAYRREVTFYSQLAGDLPVRVPRSYVAAQAQDTTDFVLVIEDLSDLDPLDQLAGLTPAQADAAVDALARFHGWGWESDRLGSYADRFPRLDGEIAAAVYGQFAHFFAIAWQSVREAPVVTGPARTVGNRWTELLPFFVAELSTPRTLVHGELRAENMFMTAGGEIVMIDFQTVAQHAGIVDLAYLVVQSTTTDVRHGKDERFVRRYVEQLGIADYTFDQAWRQYRIALAFNLLLTGLAFGQYEHTDDRGKQLLVEMLNRACDAIATTDALGVLPATTDV